MASSWAVGRRRPYDPSLYAVPADLTARYQSDSPNSREEMGGRENATEMQVLNDVAFGHPQKANGNNPFQQSSESVP